MCLCFFLPWTLTWMLPVPLVSGVAASTQGCSSLLPRDGEAGCCYVSPCEACVCRLLHGKSRGITPSTLCPLSHCPEGRCALESCFLVLALQLLLGRKAGSGAHVQGGGQGSGSLCKPGLGLALICNDCISCFI